MEESDSTKSNNNNKRNIISKYHVAVRAMARHPEICCLLLIIIAICLCKLGYSVQTKPLVYPPRPPSRFFPHNSLITDFPFGAMEPVSNILTDNEFIFVMFYAPWCSKSQSGKADFFRAARAMHGEVRFISINCWWKEGDCRRRMKLPSFPQFYVYHTHLNGIRYTGIIGAEYMVKFLDDLRFPLTYIFNEQQLVKFASANQNTVIGYFDFGTLPEPPGFQQYYYASMRMLENELANAPSFAVITGDHLPSLLGILQTNSVVLLRRYDTTMRFPDEVQLTSSTLVDWLLKNMMKPTVSWVIPPGQKSLQLSTHLDESATVVHLTRLDPLFNLHHSVIQLEKVALAYNYCGNHTSVENSINNTMNKGIMATNNYLKTQSMCEELKRKKKHFLYSKLCCVSVVTKGEKNRSSEGRSNTCEVCQYYDTASINQNTDCPMNSFWLTIPSSLRTSRNMCSEIMKNYNVHRHTSVCCGLDVKSDHHPILRHIQGRRPTDSFVSMGKERAQRHECRKLRLHSSQHLPDSLYPANSNITQAYKSAKLGCQTNKTVSFVIMDSKYQEVFAERFSGEFSGAPHKASSLTVIIDTKNEWHSVLNETFSETSVDLFLYKYTISSLSGYQRSEEPANLCDPNQTVCVLELNTKSFHSVVMDTNKDVLVLFYASWCGFCAQLAHVYLALAKYFKSAQNIVFTRINGDKNDLPWQFTVDAYPTLIFFPAKRKEDSAVFPDVLAKSIPNLIKFVLRHSSPELRLDTASGICSSSCVRRNKREISFTIVELYKHERKLKRKLPIISHSISEIRKTARESNGALDARSHLLLSQFTFLKKQLARTEQQIKSAKLLEKTLLESGNHLSIERIQRFHDHHKLYVRNFLKGETIPRRDEL